MTTLSATPSAVPTNGSASMKKEIDGYGKNVFISNHPILNHKTSVLRSSTSDQQTFRSVLREVTCHLAYEATSTLKTREVPLSVSIGKERNQMECMGTKVADRVSLIPILRSGLGMADGMLELLPKASVHHIGMYHLSGSPAPVQYFNRLPKKCDADIAYVVDPVIASAATMMAVIAILKKWGVPKIHVVCVISSHHGLKTLSEAHPDVSFTVAQVDEVLTKDGIVLPGLGDAGVRLFGTDHDQLSDEDEALLQPSKRKRSSSSL
eukprot:scaffold1391_cov123-Cylindrotheca_fusiformis.AAC.4